MKIGVYCQTHEAPVVPDPKFIQHMFNWKPANNIEYKMHPDDPMNYSSNVFEIDVHSFFCTGGHGEHQYTIWSATDDGRHLRED